MRRTPREAQKIFEEQLCYFWLRNDFITWAKGAGFMASLLGEPEVRDVLKWLVNIRILKAEEVK